VVRGGAFGHGVYNGIGGTPIFYWLNQVGAATVTLSSLSVKDASGNTRSFVLYAADGENTNSPETITYASTANWRLIDTVNYYALFNGNVPTLTGIGTTSVVESGPLLNDGNYNASVVLGTSSPTQVSSTFGGNEATLFAVSLPPITFNIVLTGRVSASDQFTAAIAYTSPAASIKSVTTSGAATTAGTGATSVIGTNSVTLSAAMAAGSFSPLSTYAGSMAAATPVRAPRPSVALTQCYRAARVPASRSPRRPATTSPALSPSRRRPRRSAVAFTTTPTTTMR